MIRKVDIYPLEKVNERISYYENELINPSRSILHVTNCLLNFWKNYKANHYPNG